MSVDDAPATAPTDAAPEPADGDFAYPDPLAAVVRPLAIPRVVPTPTRRVAEWTLLRTRRDPRRLTFLLMPVVLFGSTFLSYGLQAGALRPLAAPLCAVALPWMAGVVVSMNPLGDEGAVLPVTLTTTSGTHYVRGHVLPGLLFGLPAVILVTASATLVSPYSLFQRIALIGLAGFLTVITTTVAPAVGMRFPRFSAIRVGQSRAVLPPRMTTVILHLLVTVLPGSTLALLVVAPGLARVLIAGLTGFLPAIVVRLIGGTDGPLSPVAPWFEGLGQAVQSIAVGQFQFLAGSLLVVGGTVVAGWSYRYAIRRYERYDPG